MSKPADVIAERAGRFVELYQDTLYPKHRNGARYHKRRPVLDFAEAEALCRTWDDARLEKLATMFLTTNHAFAASGTRSIAQFAALASLMDSLLCDWETKQ